MCLSKKPTQMPEQRPSYIFPLSNNYLNVRHCVLDETLIYIFFVRMKNSRIVARINFENTACKCPSGKEFSWSNIKITESHNTFLLESICFNDWCFPFVLVSGVHLRTRSKYLQYYVRRVRILGNNAVLQFKFQSL